MKQNQLGHATLRLMCVFKCFVLICIGYVSSKQQLQEQLYNEQKRLEKGWFIDEIQNIASMSTQSFGYITLNLFYCIQNQHKVLMQLVVA